MKRHTCIICGSKRYKSNMKNVFLNSWACIKTKYYFQTSVCSDSLEIKEAIEVINIISKWENIKLTHLRKINEISLIVTPERTISRGNKG